MRQIVKWLVLSSVAVALLVLGCQGPPEQVEEAEPAPAAEPEPAAEAAETEPAAEEPKQEESEPEGSAQAAPAGGEGLSARNAWAPGKKGKLLLGLDGGLYDPYRVRVIAEVQEARKAQGLYAGAVHRYLDEETMKALGEFQKQNELKVSGVPTPRTRKALLSGNEA